MERGKLNLQSDMIWPHIYVMLKFLNFLLDFQMHELGGSTMTFRWF